MNHPCCQRMPARRVIAAMVFLAVARCGGKFLGEAGDSAHDDASVSGEGGVSSDGALSDAGEKDSSCSLDIDSEVTMSDASCTGTQRWTCDTSKFEVICECPKGACTCVVDDNVGLTALTTLACPSCDVHDNAKKLALLCGFPVP